MGRREAIRRLCRTQGWIVSITLFVAVLFPVAAYPELVDHIVAAVNNEVITWSELRQAVNFNRAFAASEDVKKVEMETLEGLINRRLLIQEARRLKFGEVSEQDINAEIEKLKKRFASEKAFSDFLAGLDTTEKQIGRVLGERLLVERFVGKKVGLFVRVGTDEARRYFETHSADFKGKRFQEVGKKITAFISEQKTERELARYLAELRGKADIRINP